MKVLLLALLASAIFAGVAQAGTPQLQEDVVGSGRPTGASAQYVQTRIPGKSFHTLYGSSFLDSLASGVSGWGLTTALEDDPVEWAYLFGMDTNVAGFVRLLATSPTDPYYHRIFLGPVPTVTFLKWFGKQPVTYYEAAVALMTVVHEADHYRLFSADEGRVNACALQEFPSVLQTYFQVSPTTTTTAAVKKVVWRKKWAWAHRHGRRVRVKKRVRRVVVTYVQQTVENPEFSNFVQAAQQFYASQPPPYNTGTCW
jgi:hypothetical protein